MRFSSPNSFVWRVLFFLFFGGGGPLFFVVFYTIFSTYSTKSSFNYLQILHLLVLQFLLPHFPYFFSFFSFFSSLYVSYFTDNRFNFCKVFWKCFIISFDECFVRCICAILHNLRHFLDIYFHVFFIYLCIFPLHLRKLPFFCRFRIILSFIFFFTVF